jgi:adenosylmethionine-8-amino-7-oxononanoate aminotransferase
MFVGRWTGYHGASYGALAVGGSPQRIKFEPVLPGVEHVFPPYCYRCPYCEKDGECNLLCARIIEEVVKCRGAENIAAFISEPVSLLCPDTPPEYWSIVKEICEENDILLMIDEIMTGFGRTGKLFAVENWNLIPDIMTIGKGMSSGYLPLSASCAKPEITESFWGELEEGRTFEHAFGWSTHNAISCAAANACIDVIERERIAEKTADKGRYMIKRLKELEEIPIVGEVRGRYGMMASLELVTDKDSKKIPPPERMKVVAKQIQRMFWENGLAEWFHGNIVPLMPPLSISIEEIDRSFHIMDTVLREVNEKKLMSS